MITFTEHELNNILNQIPRDKELVPEKYGDENTIFIFNHDIVGSIDPIYKIIQHPPHRSEFGWVTPFTLEITGVKICDDSGAKLAVSPFQSEIIKTALSVCCYVEDQITEAV